MATEKFIVLKLGDELYGIPVHAVERILPDQTITKVPASGKNFLGTFALRGDTLPAFDLRRWFEMPTFEGESNYVVLESATAKYALKVDAVDGIWEIDSKDLDANHPMLQSDRSGFFSAVVQSQHRLVALLDINKLLDEKLQREVANLGAA